MQVPKPGPRNKSVSDKNDILSLLSGIRGFEVGDGHTSERLEARQRNSTCLNVTSFGLEHGLRRD